MPAVDAFLQLFTPQPGYKILDITSHADALSAALADSVEKAGGRFQLVRYPGTHDEMAAAGHIVIQDVPGFDKPFRALPRDNDIVFIRNVLHRHSQPERILRAIYTTLTNATEVVIVTDDAETDVPAQLAMLEKLDFRAGNLLEGIAEGQSVVMGKKMHMWGNGL